MFLFFIMLTAVQIIYGNSAMCFKTDIPDKFHLLRNNDLGNSRSVELTIPQIRPDSVKTNQNYENNNKENKYNVRDDIINELSESEKRYKRQTPFLNHNTRPLNGFLTRQPNRIPNYLHTNNPEVAKQMNDAQKLLERLQRLSKQKEQHKQQNGQNSNETVNQEQSQTDKPKPMDHKDGDNDIENNNFHDTNDKVNNEMKSIKKKKFFFQMQPVVPEDEIEKNYETVYYYTD